MSFILNKFEDLEALVFDVDGVFTDSGLLIQEDGHMLRQMSAQDGFAMKLLAKYLRVGVITGGKSEGVVKRLNGLGISHIFTKTHDKLPVFKELLDDWEINRSKCLYIGDDIFDIPCIEYAGIGACPRNACHQVIDAADYICRNHGGKGAVREISEITLRAKKMWVTRS